MIKHFLLWALLSATQAVMAQNEDSVWFVNNYTKIERQIPMRDGIKLFTAVYVPKAANEKHPFLITRTPYSCSPYGEGNYAAVWNGYRMAYARKNYILV